MVVRRQVFRGDFGGECSECTRKVGHLPEELFRQDALRFQKMSQHGKMTVDGVEQPEVGDIRGGKVGQGLVFLAAATGELAAARYQQSIMLLRMRLSAG